jgi:hypothetical protein
MHRRLRATTLGLAVTAALLLAPTTAAVATGAQAADGTISATSPDMVLTEAPLRRASAMSDVVVRNSGTTATQGFFLLDLPEGIELGATDICDTVGAGMSYWLCGGGEITAGGSRTYQIRLTAEPGEGDPEFGVHRPAFVTGRTADGRLGTRDRIEVTWPATSRATLVATKAAAGESQAKINIKVTNRGTYDLPGYLVDVVLGSGMSPISGSCVVEPDDPIGCQVRRTKVLPIGATDTFWVTVALSPEPALQSVEVHLSPGSRFVGGGTSTVLEWGTPVTPSASPSVTASASPTPTPSTPPSVIGGTVAGSGSGAGGGAALPAADEPELPITAEMSFLVAGGAALLGLGVVLFMIPRRRSTAGH